MVPKTLLNAKLYLERGAVWARVFIDDEDDEDGRGDVDLETLEDCLPPSDILNSFGLKHFFGLFHSIFSIFINFSCNKRMSFLRSR